MGKKLVILGAGESGIGAALLAKKKGFDVFISDQKKIDQELQELLNKEGIQWEAGQHSIEVMLAAQFVVKSPGIPFDIPLI